MAIPNTTPTPNELYNGEMAKMTDTELRIVLITTRATLGWEKDKETKMRKQEDWISHYQLIKKSGRSSRSITKAIDNCVKMGWIEIRDKNGELLNTKNKRIGNKMYFRLGKLFLDKIEIFDKPFYPTNRKKFTEEYLNKLKNNLTGKKLSEETRIKMSEEIGRAHV